MEVDTTQFNDIYKEMAELLGDAAALKMWNRYAGVSVSFPKQLYSREYIRKFIHDNSDVMKPSDIAAGERVASANSPQCSGKESINEQLQNNKGRQHYEQI